MYIFNGNSTGIHSVFEMTFLCRVGGIRTTSRQPSRSIVAVVAATLVACLPNYVMYRPVPYVTSATAHRSVAANASCPVSAPNNSNHTRNVTWPGTRDVKASRPMWPRGQIIRFWPQPRPHSFWPRLRSRPHGIWPRPHRNWHRGLEYLQCT